MIDLMAALLILLTGIYLVGLAMLAVLSPEHASRFLAGFASTPSAHRLELLLRTLVALALLRYASQMLLPSFFVVLGWVLLLTSAGLFVLPWEWHRRFAQRTVPHATRNLGWLAIGALALGAFVLASLFLAGTTTPLT